MRLCCSNWQRVESGIKGTKGNKEWQERARKLLLDTDRNIAEISEDIGCNNAHHFTTAFKKKCGVTPKRYKSTDTPELDYAMTRQ